MVSDGKPNDYDRYEGRYGIEDVRKAVQEAKDEHIEVFSLAIDHNAKFYIPRMFGSQGYRILGHATQLPQALTEFYARVASAS